MQNKQRQRMVELNISTIHVHINMINIKLGTIVHLRTCVVWLIRLFWLSCPHRIILLRKFYWVSLFSLPTSWSSHLRFPFLCRTASLTSFWSQWGSGLKHILRRTACGLSMFASTFFQLIFPHVLRLVPVPLMKASLAGDWLWTTRRIEDLFHGFVKRW